MQLIVKPISASLTHDTETFSRMDPYCVCVINGQRQKTRTHQEGGKQPRWNDSLMFTITNPSGMNVQVWDEDNIVDDLVGEGYIDLSSYMSGAGMSRNENVVLTYKGKRAGMVNINIQVQGGMGGMGMGNMMGGGMMNNNGWGNMGGNMGGPMNNGWGQPPMNNGWGQGNMNNGWGNQAPMGNNGWGNMGNNNGWGNMGGGYNNGW